MIISLNHAISNFPTIYLYKHFPYRQTKYHLFLFPCVFHLTSLASEIFKLIPRPSALTLLRKRPLQGPTYNGRTIPNNLKPTQSPLETVLIPPNEREQATRRDGGLFAQIKEHFDLAQPD